MPGQVLEYFREKEPKFKDVDDHDLTLFIMDKYPQFLQDEQFKSQAESVDAWRRGEPGGREEPLTQVVEGERVEEPVAGDMEWAEKPNQYLFDPDQIGKPKVWRQTGQVPLALRDPRDVTRSAEITKLYERGASAEALEYFADVDWDATSKARMEPDPTKQIGRDQYITKQETEAKEQARADGLFQMIDREKKKAIEEGGSGWAYLVERMPFIGAGKKMQDFALLYDSAQRLESGDYEEGMMPGAPPMARFEREAEDVKRVGKFLAQMESEEAKGFWRKTTDIATAIPGFASEFILTSGTYSLGKETTEQAVKKLVKSKLSKQTRALVEKGIKRKMRDKLVGSIALRGGKVTGFLGGGATQAVAMPHMVAENFFEILAQDKLAITQDEKGELQAAFSEEDPSFVQALYEAYARTAVETVSERTGIFATKFFGKTVGKLASAEFKSGRAMVPGLKAVLARRWLKAKPGRTTGELLEKLKEKAAWSGVVGEVFEERVAEVGRAALTRDEWVGWDRSAGDWFEQLASESLAFAVPGGARKHIIEPLIEKDHLSQAMRERTDVAATAYSLPAERGGEFIADVAAQEQVYAEMREEEARGPQVDVPKPGVDIDTKMDFEVEEEPATEFGAVKGKKYEVAEYPAGKEKFGIRKQTKKGKTVYRAVRREGKDNWTGFPGRGQGEYATREEAEDALVDRVKYYWANEDFRAGGKMEKFGTPRMRQQIIDWQKGLYDEDIQSEEEVRNIKRKDMGARLGGPWDDYSKSVRSLQHQALIDQYNVGRKMRGLEPLPKKAAEEAPVEAEEASVEAEEAWPEGQDKSEDFEPQVWTDWQGERRQDRNEEYLENIAENEKHAHAVKALEIDRARNEPLSEHDDSADVEEQLSDEQLETLEEKTGLVAIQPEAGGGFGFYFNKPHPGKRLGQRASRVEKAFQGGVYWFEESATQEAELVAYKAYLDRAGILGEHEAAAARERMEASEKKAAPKKKAKKKAKKKEVKPKDEVKKTPPKKKAAVKKAPAKRQSLVVSMQEVLKGKQMEPNQIMEAMKKKGYKFTGRNPMNSIRVALYTNKSKFNNNRGVFSLQRAPRKKAAVKPKEEVKKAPPKKKAAVKKKAAPKKKAATRKKPAKKAAPKKKGAGPASYEKATLPRKITAPHHKTGEPVSLQEIREYISKALDIPIRKGVGRMRVHGFYRPDLENIRMKWLNNVPTISHEVGHYLHYLIFPQENERVKGDPYAGGRSASTFNEKFDDELLALGKRTSRKSYTKAQKRMEGVAEFTRLYMTDRDSAHLKAPEFFRFFRDHLYLYPQINKALDKVYDMVQKYTNQPGFNQVSSMIAGVDERPGEKGGVKLWLRDMYDEWVNELAPLERAVQQLKDYGLDVEDDKMADQLAIAYMGGWRGKVEHSIWHNQIDAEGNEVGPSLKQVLSGVENLHEFQVYLVARRALEKMKQGKETGFTQESAQEVVTTYGDRYEEVSERLDKFMTNELMMLMDADFISGVEFDTIKKKNQDYVPFHRMYERVSGGGRGGRGFVDLSKGGLKGFHGDDLKIYPPLESIIKNMYLTRDMVERQRIGKAFVDNFLKTPGGGRIGDPVVRNIKPVKVDAEEIKRKLKKLGLVYEGVDGHLYQVGTDELVDENSLSFKIWRATQTDSAEKGIFSIWRDGSQEFYQIDDPALYASLKLQDSTAAEVLSRMPYVKVAGKFTRTLRAGATLTLEFIARNPFRDQVQAAVYSKYGYIPFFDGFRGMLSALKKDKHYKAWLKSSGRYADFLALDRTDLTKTLDDVVPPGWKHHVKKWANPLQTLRRVSELMEMATRLQEYKLAIARGASPTEAANASKTITLNYARFGFRGKAVNQLTAFFNAKAQDWDKFGREHVGPGRLGVMAKGIQWITVPSLLLWYLGKDDDEINGLAPWRKIGMWNINMRWAAEAAGIDTEARDAEGNLENVPIWGDWVFSFPKPFLLGYLYGSAPEAALDWVYKDDPKAITDFFKELSKESPLPLNLDPEQYFFQVGLAPTVTKPVIEALGNINIHTGAPLENEAQLQYERWLRSNGKTTEVMKYLAEQGMIYTDGALNVSPIVLDNFVRSYTGGLGAYGMDFVDALMLWSSLVDTPPQPAMTWKELPGIKAFVKGRFEPHDALRQFHEGMQLVEQRQETFRRISLTRKPDHWYVERFGERVSHYRRTGPIDPSRSLDDAVSGLDRLRRAQDNLSTIRRNMEQVRDDREMSREQKSADLFKLYGERDDVAKDALQWFHPEDLRDVKR